MGPSMIRLRHKLCIYALRLFDQALLVVVLLVVINQFGQHQGTGSLSYLPANHYNPTKFVGIALLAIWWISSFNALVRYDTNCLKSLKSQLFDVFKATSVAASLLMLVAAVFSFKVISNEVAIVFLVTTCTL